MTCKRLILKAYFFLFLFIFVSYRSTNAQSQSKIISQLDISSDIPDFRISKWVKGPEISTIEKGRIYVIELFASWCKPCRYSMPRLSLLVSKYDTCVVFMAIDIMDGETPNIDKVKKIVTDYGSAINYSVGIDSNLIIETNWYKPLVYQNGIPFTVVVDRNSKIAWYGHPQHLDGVLNKVVENKWDLAVELEKKQSERRLDSIAQEIQYNLFQFRSEWRSDSTDKPLEALDYIDSVVKDDSLLKLHRNIKYEKFYSLIQVDQNEAVRYGRKILDGNMSLDDQSDIIIDIVSHFENKLELSKDVFRLSADACQIHLNNVAYPEGIVKYKLYCRTASWYYFSGDFVKAKAAIAVAKALAEGSEKAPAEYILRIKALEKKIDSKYPQKM